MHAASTAKKPAQAQKPGQNQKPGQAQQGAKPGAHAAKPAHDQAPQAPGMAHVPATVRTGSKGAEVRMLQILLKKTGLEPGPIDGDFGPATHGAVVQFQEKKGLEVDGIVGVHTWGALRDKTGSDLNPAEYGAPAAKPGSEKKAAKHDEKPAAPAKKPGGGKGPSKPAGNPKDEAKLRADILRVAESQIGTLEKGQNKGGATKYQQAFGRGAEPWCADFVSWVYSQAGKETNSPYCPTFVQQLKKQGRWKGHANPEPGDIVFFDWDGDKSPDHVGIVKSVNGDGTITTIEGNTSNPKNHNQEGVFEKSRGYDKKRGNDQVFGFGSVS